MFIRLFSGEVSAWSEITWKIVLMFTEPLAIRACGLITPYLLASFLANRAGSLTFAPFTTRAAEVAEASHPGVEPEAAVGAEAAVRPALDRRATARAPVVARSRRARIKHRLSRGPERPTARTVEPVRPARVKVCDRFVTMFSTRSPGSPRFVRALR